MSSPYVGQLLLVPYNFAPVGWAFCQGQLLSIAENSTLFNLIGTTYGGDGQTTFALPDLRGRTTIGTGQGPGLSNFVIGQAGGAEEVTLTPAQLPAHTHPAIGSSTAANSVNAGGCVPGSGQTIYRQNATPAAMLPNMCSTVGGSQPHNNLQPYNTLNWIISLFGVFPSPT